MPSVQEDGNSMTIRAEDIIEILEREIRHLRCENVRLSSLLSKRCLEGHPVVYKQLRGKLERRARR